MDFLYVSAPWSTFTKLTERLSYRKLDHRRASTRDTKMTLLLCALLLLFNLCLCQDCQFVGTSWKKPTFPESECPCFHSETTSNSNSSCLSNVHPLGPLVECAFLPKEFIECSEPIDHAGNETARYICKDFNIWGSIPATPIIFLSSMVEKNQQPLSQNCSFPLTWARHRLILKSVLLLKFSILPHLSTFLFVVCTPGPGFNGFSDWFRILDML